MARNSVESSLIVQARVPVVLEGVLISRTKTSTVFKYKPPLKRVVVQEPFANEDVIAYGPDKLIVFLTTRVGRKTTGIVDVTDAGIVMNGLTYNPQHVKVSAELGVEDAGKKARPAKAAPAAAPARRRPA